ncbi:MAG: DUF1080 domain-containing protein [Planctomycetota bacterium]
MKSRIDTFVAIITWLGVTCIGALAMAQSPSSGLQSFEPVPPGFRPLFDSAKGTEGWHARPHFDPNKLAAMSEEVRDQKLNEWMTEAAKHWRVEGDELINDGEGPYLVTNDEFRDYELIIDYATVPMADSGIYLKANPQVQIWDYTRVDRFELGSDLGSGGLWNNPAGSKGKDPLVLADRSFGQWNRFFIRQIGSRTTVYLNGRLVVDHAIMNNYWQKDQPFPVRGPIALQTHGGEIRWRNLAIRELSPDESASILLEHERQRFSSVFDGETLDGWIGNTGSYEVANGAIRCIEGQGGNLLSEDIYQNFQWRLMFQLPPGGNNGLAIRMPTPKPDGKRDDPAYQGMCELQVLDNPHPKYTSIDDRQRHGSAYAMVPAKTGYLRPAGQWNFQEVTVDGSTVSVELNGTRILDADLSRVTEFMNDRPHPGKDRTEGHIGFAGHNDPVEYRELWIRRLP